MIRNCDCYDFGNTQSVSASAMADAATLSLQNRGPTVLTVTIVMLCLSTASITLRLISRIGVVKKVSMDDYAIILAWVSNSHLGLAYLPCDGG